jgi:hypothetical protein
MNDASHDNLTGATTPGSTRRTLSRRSMLTAAAGGVAVSGLGLATAVPSAAAAEVNDDAVGVGPRGTTTVEFRGRIDQTGDTGELFTSYGYLTRVTKTEQSHLFDNTPYNETTALLTAYATGDLSSRILDMSVHSLDIIGTMTVYQRASGGASFADPASFKVGTPVARYELTLQDALAVYATAQGIPTLTGDMLQKKAHDLSGPLTGHQFGRKGLALRMFATGLGSLTDPVTLNARLEIVGNWSVE